MLKFIFWSLLTINAALFAYGRGYLGHFSGNEREPARLQKQLNASKLLIIDAAKANTTATPAPAASAPAEALACLEVGNFVLAEARRFETQLAPLNLGDRQSRRNLPGTEVSSYMVFIPAQPNKEGAERKASELKQLGVKNYFIMSDNPAMRWAISLGVFKTEAAAQNQLAALQKQGVHSARVAPRMSGSKLLAFQFREVSPELKGKLEQLRAAFPNTETRSCK